jgi:exonuclease III
MIELCGFFDCQREAGIDDVPTWWMYKRVPKWRLDYLFASTRLRPRFLGCEVGSAPEIAAMSDHRPVIAEFG